MKKYEPRPGAIRFVFLPIQPSPAAVARAWRGLSPLGRSPARWYGPSPPAPAPARRASLLPRLHVQLRAREGAATVLEELDVAEPAPVGPPLLLQADRRRQRLLDGAERLHVALHREVLDRKARALQRGARLVLAPGKARAPAGLFPLVGVKGDEVVRRAASERAAGALGDRGGHTEVSDDGVRLERGVL